jgi:hypothetical protein
MSAARIRGRTRSSIGHGATPLFGRNDPAARDRRSVLLAAASIEGRTARPMRLHFFGKAISGARSRRASPLAREAASASGDRGPGRLDYLDALQMLADAHVNLVLGSDERHQQADCSPR